MRIDETSDRVLRFSVTERALHWGFALGYVLLIVSGLPLMFPALREVIRDYSPEIGRRLHLAGAAVWVGSVVAIFCLGDRRVLRATWRDLITFGPDDRTWLRSFPRWWLGRDTERERIDCAVGRFNAAQKLNALFTLVSCALLIVTGLALVPVMLATGTSVGGAGWREAHRVLTLLVLIPLVGHIYLAAVHRPTRPALGGMIQGRVDADWARLHHPRWLADADGRMPSALGEAERRDQR